MTLLGKDLYGQRKSVVKGIQGQFVCRKKRGSESGQLELELDS